MDSSTNLRSRSLRKSGKVPKGVDVRRQTEVRESESDSQSITHSGRKTITRRSNTSIHESVVRKYTTRKDQSSFDENELFPWEKSPKTDYTYARSTMYDTGNLDPHKVPSPNMSRVSYRRPGVAGMWKPPSQDADDSSSSISAFAGSETPYTQRIPSPASTRSGLHYGSQWTFSPIQPSFSFMQASRDVPKLDLDGHDGHKDESLATRFMQIVFTVFSFITMLSYVLLQALAYPFVALIYVIAVACGYESKLSRDSLLHSTACFMSELPAALLVILPQTLLSFLWTNLVHAFSWNSYSTAEEGGLLTRSFKAVVSSCSSVFLMLFYAVMFVVRVLLKVIVFIVVDGPLAISKQVANIMYQSATVDVLTSRDENGEADRVDTETDVEDEIPEADVLMKDEVEPSCFSSFIHTLVYLPYFVLFQAPVALGKLIISLFIKRDDFRYESKEDEMDAEPGLWTILLNVPGFLFLDVPVRVGNLVLESFWSLFVYKTKEDELHQEIDENNLHQEIDENNLHQEFDEDYLHQETGEDYLHQEINEDYLHQEIDEDERSFSLYSMMCLVIKTIIMLPYTILITLPVYMGTSTTRFIQYIFGQTDLATEGKGEGQGDEFDEVNDIDRERIGWTRWLADFILFVLYTVIITLPVSVGAFIIHQISSVYSGLRSLFESQPSSSTVFGKLLSHAVYLPFYLLYFLPLKVIQAVLRAVGLSASHGSESDAQLYSVRSDSSSNMLSSLCDFLGDLPAFLLLALPTYIISSLMSIFRKEELESVGYETEQRSADSDDDGDDGIVRDRESTTGWLKGFFNYIFSTLAFLLITLPLACGLSAWGLIFGNEDINTESGSDEAASMVTDSDDEDAESEVLIQQQTSGWLASAVHWLIHSLGFLLVTLPTIFILFLWEMMRGPKHNITTEKSDQDEVDQAVDEAAEADSGSSDDAAVGDDDDESHGYDRMTEFILGVIVMLLVTFPLKVIRGVWSVLRRCLGLSNRDEDMTVVDGDDETSGEKHGPGDVDTEEEEDMYDGEMESVRVKEEDGWIKSIVNSVIISLGFLFITLPLGVGLFAWDWVTGGRQTVKAQRGGNEAAEADSDLSDDAAVGDDDENHGRDGIIKFILSVIVMLLVTFPLKIIWGVWSVLRWCLGLSNRDEDMTVVDGDDETSGEKHGPGDVDTEEEEDMYDGEMESVRVKEEDGWIKSIVNSVIISLGFLFITLPLGVGLFAWDWVTGGRKTVKAQRGNDGLSETESEDDILKSDAAKVSNTDTIGIVTSVCEFCAMLPCSLLFRWPYRCVSVVCLAALGCLGFYDDQEHEVHEKKSSLTSRQKRKGRAADVDSDSGIESASDERTRRHAVAQQSGQSDWSLVIWLKSLFNGNSCDNASDVSADTWSSQVSSSLASVISVIMSVILSLPLWSITSQKTVHGAKVMHRVFSKVVFIDTSVLKHTNSVRRQYGWCWILLLLLLPLLMLAGVYVMRCGGGAILAGLPLGLFSGIQGSNDSSGGGTGFIHTDHSQEQSRWFSSDDSYTSPGAVPASDSSSTDHVIAGGVPGQSGCDKAAGIPAGFMMVNEEDLHDRIVKIVQEQQANTMVTFENNQKQNLVIIQNQIRQDYTSALEKSVPIIVSSHIEKLVSELEVERQALITAEVGTVMAEEKKKMKKDQEELAAAAAAAMAMSDTDKDARVTTLGLAVSDTKEAVAGIADRVGETEATVNSLNTQIQSIVTSQNNLGDTQSLHAASLADLKQQLHDIQTKSNSLAAAMATSQTDSVGAAAIAGLETELAALKTQVNTLDKTLAALQLLTKNCCRDDAALVLLAQRAYMDSALKMMYGDSAGQVNYKDPASLNKAFLAWLNSQFVGQGDLEERLAAILGRVEGQVRSEGDAVYERIVRDVAAGLIVPPGGGSGTGSVIAGLSQEEVEKLIKQAILLYDADKTGIVDYALESAGGSVISTRCSETFNTKNAQISMFGIPLMYQNHSPRTVIQAGVNPGECWAFKGTTGYLVIQLSRPIQPTAFTIEHIPKSLSPSGNISSAPQNFTVIGLDNEHDKEGVYLGNFSYSAEADPLQTFTVNKQVEKKYQHVELRILSNHGNIHYTCLYRFRVHGNPN